MILPDSSAWIDFFNGARTQTADRLQDALDEGRALVGDLVLAEVLQGFRSDLEYHRARKLFDPLPCHDMVGRDIAVAAANNYRRLRAAGVTVRGTIDMLIATFCIERGHILLHSDRDFEPMAKYLGLRTI